MPKKGKKVIKKVKIVCLRGHDLHTEKMKTDENDEICGANYIKCTKKLKNIKF